ncbi:MAG: D-arabinono-1,4-lactone oxidase [Acidimicrobiales bacterium]
MAKPVPKIWRNWAGNQTCAPISVETPTSEDEIVGILRGAAAAERRVKVVGAGHSFTGIACTDGHLIDLERYARVLGHDEAAGTVTVQAGISLAALSDALDSRGLALENMGDVGYQSIAGATSTATHGTGTRFGNLATAIVGLRLITADGSVLELSCDEHADVFDVSRVGLGALGVLSTVTLKPVPAFRLHAVETPMPIDDLLRDFGGFMRSSDHVEFFWVPGTRWALTKRNTRTLEPARPRSAAVRIRDDILIGNAAFGLVCRVGRRFPRAIPRLAKAMPSAAHADYVERSDKVFTSPRFVRFYEMEYAIALEAVPEALGRVRHLVERLRVPISFPVEVRAVAADDIPLSTAYGRATGYIAVHVYRGTPYDQYFQGVEAIMNDYGGRPHWGKMHYQTAETLSARYERWRDFRDVRVKLDPTGMFANPYLDRVLGPIGG